MTIDGIIFFGIFTLAGIALWLIFGSINQFSARNGRIIVFLPIGFLLLLLAAAFLGAMITR